MSTTDYPSYAQYVLRVTQWKAITFQVLNEELCLWIARVETTHNTKGGMPEVTFTVLGRGYQYITINDDEVSVLKQWFQAQEG